MLLVEERTDEITVDEAAQLLNISRATVLRRIEQGRLTPINEMNPALDRPRRIILRRAEVERLARTKQDDSAE